MTSSRLTKHPADRVWAGVCAGIADWLGVDAVLIRLAWLAWAVFGDAGSAFVVYIVLMIIMPDADPGRRALGGRSRYRSGRPGGPWAVSMGGGAPPEPPAVVSAPSTPETAPAASAPPAGRAPSPTADELGDVVLRLLDATVEVAVSVARGVAKAVRAGAVVGGTAYRAPTARRSEASPPPSAAPDAYGAPIGAGAPPPAEGPAPASAVAAPVTASAAPSDEPPQLESDEERLQRELRARLDRQVGDARAAVGATREAVTDGERLRRRSRLRQLAGFGVLAFGVWGLAATLGVHPIALSGAALSSMTGAAVVTAAVLIGLGTYLLWTAVRRHG